MTTTTADRVLDTMSLFSGEHAEWTVEDAAERLHLPVSTVYRYFKSLTRAGLIHPYVPGHYSLGPAIVQFDRQIRLHDPLVTAARDEMSSLARKFGNESVILLARLYHHDVMCIHQTYHERPPFAVSYERGRLMPLDRGAASKVILANLNSRALRSLSASRGEPEPSASIKDVALRKELRAIRTQGYSITQAELDTGLMGIAVPIFASDQTIDGSLSVVVPGSREDRDFLIENLIRTRKAIEAALAIRLHQSNKISEEWRVAEPG